MEKSNRSAGLRILTVASIRAVVLLLIHANVLLVVQRAPGQNRSQTSERNRPNIILISIDTLRADHVSCYSVNTPKTVNIDKLCQGGSLFTQTNSMVPLTLPSHVSLLTSTYPFANGVEDNGDILAPASTTLASTLRTNGYKTAAFVSSFVLDRRFGLDQGFDTYDGLSAGTRTDVSDAGDIKRRGGETVNAAEQWLTANRKQPFFLFLHLYDLHTPYTLSATDRDTYGVGYNGELAYTDHVLGQFWEYLDAHALLSHSLIVLTSDHGEGLGDHDETTHGFFLYQSTLHVPLIMHWPMQMPTPGHVKSPSYPARVGAPASLLDVSPTILKAAHIAVPATMQGRNLRNLPETNGDVYSQTIYPLKHFDSSALASLQRGRYKYIDAPHPEFYDLILDPGEQHNLYKTRTTFASAYRERLKQVRDANRPRSPVTTSTLSPEAVERLHALGYMAGRKSNENAAQSLVDPKDRIGDYEAYGRAIELATLGKVEDADKALSAILERDPRLSDVRLTLGLNLQRLGKDAEALQELKSVLAVDPQSEIAHLDAGLSYYNLHQFDDAEKESEAALVIFPAYTKAALLHAKTMAQKGNTQQAEAEFQHILTDTPDSYDAHDGLGTLAAMRGDWNEAVMQLQAALAIEPGSPQTHNTLGSVYLRNGSFQLARRQFEEAVREQPNYAWAHYNLGLALSQLGEGSAAEAEFEKALRAEPNFQAARDALHRFAKSP